MFIWIFCWNSVSIMNILLSLLNNQTDAFTLSGSGIRYALHIVAVDRSGKCISRLQYSWTATGNSLHALDWSTHGGGRIFRAISRFIHLNIVDFSTGTFSAKHCAYMTILRMTLQDSITPITNEAWDVVLNINKNRVQWFSNYVQPKFNWIHYKDKIFNVQTD